MFWYVCMFIKHLSSYKPIMYLYVYNTMLTIILVCFGIISIYNICEIYFKQEYETKLNMLQELMRSNMKGLDFSDIRRQEVVRYLDNVATIADTDFKRKVDKRINQMNIELEAREQFDNNND